MAADDCETFEGARCVSASGKAIRVRLASGAYHWIPNSVVDEDSEVFKDGDEGKLVVKSWFCEKEGIE